MTDWGYFATGWPYEPRPAGAPGVSAEELRLREAALAQAPLFADLPKRHLRAIAKSTGVSGYGAGETVVEESAPGSALFVLLEGRARVEQGGRTVTRFGPGDFFGEISLLDGEPRSASVVAEETLRCLVLDGRNFRETLDREPLIAMRILREMAVRLRRTQAAED
jgi:CRP/FNR family transcriptional regulator, cyclic AMP receptor protein